MPKSFWLNWKTTASGIAIIILWLLKLIVKVDIPADVIAAITAIIVAIGLFFAGDAPISP